MRIAIIGYGKMGKEIEKIALERGHSISARLSSSNAGFDTAALADTDVAIEFTKPESAVQNIKVCSESKVPVVVGTTGWYDEFDSVSAHIEQNNSALFYATNFSMGVNIFWKVNQYLAKIMDAYPAYNVDMEEIHHTQKLDAPSGTAITTAEKIIAKIDRKKNWKLDEENQPEELKIIAKREPDVPGTHEVFYRSEIDSISLKHEAHSRKGFALGSVLAAEFLNNKTGLYSMNDLLKF
ncbi:MAG: 4-hydroxy-tetrahydrodipicolinate reductase [Crocinitomicaceae bacterium]|nr:4-hydroxy-tetrahydrodipicolinate reductase [Crocinitomicaceae bacterium]|tara:strand:- start:11982 stop:12695 length:714 start_codon:yes stop_codon:yes gene_type:complete